MQENKPTTVDEYIELFPEIAQDKLKLIRSVLKSVAPDAKERIIYKLFNN